MDLVTQGLVGAIAAVSVATPPRVRAAMIIGFLAGLPADADIFIRSSEDPLLVLEYHRQFTHALAFIPIGGLLSGLLLWPWFRQRLPLGTLLRFTTIAYATSGLLDACTSYGTQLLWPFSTARIAWSLIAVFDPLFSLVLLGLLIMGWHHGSPRYTRIGVVWALAYLSFGMHQHYQAEGVARRVAAQRGHTLNRLVIKPTMGNLVLWRAVYQTDEHFHILAIRVSPLSEPRFLPGGSPPVWKPGMETPPLSASSLQFQDTLRFSRFSEGFVAPHPHRPEALGDVRYALLPHEDAPLWGIVLNAQQPDRHVHFENWRNLSPPVLATFFTLLTGTSPKLQTLQE